MAPEDGNANVPSFYAPVCGGVVTLVNVRHSLFTHLSNSSRGEVGQKLWFLVKGSVCAFFKKLFC